MQRVHRVAIARIISDIIQADRIIDAGEMACWEDVGKKYGIDREVEVEATRMTLAKAISLVGEPQMQSQRMELIGDCWRMSSSDGYCAASEALIMQALLAVLVPGGLASAVDVISVAKSNFDVDVATVLYIESAFDPTINEAIERNYRLIFKELQLAGFHFVYLPSIINHYRATDSGLFQRILSFISPALSSEGVKHAYQALIRMDTATFCKDVLCNKCGIESLRTTPPSLFIKIGSSLVGGQSFSNYLKIEVDEQIGAMVQEFVDRFTRMLKSDVYVVTSSEEKESQFHFHGFYKQLLDLFLQRRNIRSRVVIDPYKEEIFFPDIDARASGLHRREKALYALLLCRGAKGLDFTPPKTAEGFARFKEQMAQMQRQYQEIYSMFGGASESTPDLTQPEIRRPIFSCLRRSLRHLAGLYNPADYNVSKNADGVFSVHLEPELVYTAQLDSPEPVALADSALLARIKKA